MQAISKYYSMKKLLYCNIVLDRRKERRGKEERWRKAFHPIIEMRGGSKSGQINTFSEGITFTLQPFFYVSLIQY